MISAAGWWRWPGSRQPQVGSEQESEAGAAAASPMMTPTQAEGPGPPRSGRHAPARPGRRAEVQRPANPNWMLSPIAPARTRRWDRPCRRARRRRSAEFIVGPRSCGSRPHAEDPLRADGAATTRVASATTIAGPARQAERHGSGDPTTSHADRAAPKVVPRPPRTTCPAKVTSSLLAHVPTTSGRSWPTPVPGNKPRAPAACDQDDDALGACRRRDRQGLVVRALDSQLRGEEIFPGWDRCRDNRPMAIQAGERGSGDHQVLGPQRHGPRDGDASATARRHWAMLLGTGQTRR